MMTSHVSICMLTLTLCFCSQALDAYSKAIRFNPHMAAVWYNLGTLYESCRQIPDAQDAYKEANKLEPERQCIIERLRGVVK